MKAATSIEDMFVELVAFSIVAVVILVVGILWQNVSSMFGKNHPVDTSDEAKKEREDSKKT